MAKMTHGSVGAETVIPTICNSHCGGACLLRVHVRDGVVTRVESDDGEEPQFRACLRGRAYRQRVYAADRLKFPMKRIGARGEGRFERTTWDEALSKIASELDRVKTTFGAASIIYHCGGGDLHAFHHMAAIHRLLCLAGGYTATWGGVSYEGGTFAELSTYGTIKTANARDDLLNSRLIVMWGWNPASTIQNTNTCWYLAQARESGARIVCVDPRYTDSAAIFADQWIPIVPGTDAAMLAAMAYVIVTANLHDQAFLDRHTVGMDQFKDYLLGTSDGVVKNPQWAEAITSVPASTIENVAREYALAKPAALIAGIAPGRTAFGEQYHRMAITLAAMTGNIGIHGGFAGGRSWGGEHWGGGVPWAVMTSGRMRSPGNPVEQGVPSRRRILPGRGAGANSAARIRLSQLADCILEGRAGGHPSDFKLLYLANTNYLNQKLNINKVVRAFNTLEFIVVQEQFMTPTAKFADILLPVNTFFERNDIAQGGATPFYGCINEAIESLYESRSHFEIATALAAHMGITDFNDKTEEEWLRSIAAGYREVADVPDYDTWKRQGIYKVTLPEPYVAFEAEINDPDRNPFPTPSGKIEIYSGQLAVMNDENLPPIPQYIETWESRNDPLATRYPLQLITTHFRRRAHTQFDNVPWLRELQVQAISMNHADADARGIGHGDLVRVFNDRGEMLIPAHLTQRIMPGVVDIPEGAWYAPDDKGMDWGGSANVLTRDVNSPGEAVPTNTCLVQVEKAPVAGKAAGGLPTPG